MRGVSQHVSRSQAPPASIMKATLRAASRRRRRVAIGCSAYSAILAGFFRSCLEAMTATGSIGSIITQY
ncbi:hypothetical protein BSIN_1557 [Burkholderia singularis]|uniref:Uncharacterized protein n=1 Tax=Burkholderia singularis TaxID=1503053 RepID=A0A238GZ38_9BURK|nr:hypothetical protein BSIN_1557 [Burkholderia singularis]